MRKILFYCAISVVCCIMIHVNVNAQVKTKIYFESVSNTKISDAIDKGREMKITAPAIFEKLLRKEIAEDIDLTENAQLS